MKMDAGLDTGPMLAQRALSIAPDETGATLHDKLAALGAQLLIDTLPGYLSGRLSPQPQPEEGITLAPSLKKAEGQINWSQTAYEIDLLVRAFYPWPGTFTFWGNDLLKIVNGVPRPERNHKVSPGTVILEEDNLAVQTGMGLYVLQDVQPAGKKLMTSQAFFAGHPGILGTVLAMP